MQNSENWEKVRARSMAKPGVAEEYAQLPPVGLAAQLIRARRGESGFEENNEKGEQIFIESDVIGHMLESIKSVWPKL